MEQSVTQLLNGLSFGFILFLLAAGLSITFGVMQVINLSHGSFYMFGAYVGYATWKASGNLLVSIASGAIAIGLIGAGIQYFMLRRFHSLYTEHWPLILGIIFILTMLYAPRGIGGYLMLFWKWRVLVQWER